MTPRTIAKPKKLKLIKIKCPECRRYFETKRAVNNHLKKTHNVSYKIDIDSQCLVYLRTTLATNVG